MNHNKYFFCWCLAFYSGLLVADQNVTPGVQMPSVSYFTESLAHDLKKLQHEPHQGRERTVVVHYWYTVSEKKAADLKPLIMLFPGRGINGFKYNVLATTLAAQNYVVMAMDFPEIGTTIYPDGSVVEANNAYNPGALMRGPYEKVDQFFEPAVATGLADVALVKKHLRDKNHKLYGMIDFNRVGVLGHSLGGRIAGAYAAEEDNKISAYASMEGIPPRAIRLNGMPITQLHMVTIETWPYAKENYDMLINHASAPVYLTRLEGMSHNTMLAESTSKLDSQSLWNLSNLSKHISVYFNQYLKCEGVELANRNDNPLPTELFDIRN